jgi:hypothetical protein
VNNFELEDCLDPICGNYKKICEFLLDLFEEAMKITVSISIIGFESVDR